MMTLSGLPVQQVRELEELEILFDMYFEQFVKWKETRDNCLQEVSFLHEQCESCKVCVENASGKHESHKDFFRNVAKIVSVFDMINRIRDRATSCDVGSA